MGNKTILIILLVLVSFLPINNSVIAEDTTSALSEDQSLSLDANEFIGKYYVILEIISSGSYNISFNLPETVRWLRYTVINDIDYYMEDSFSSRGKTVVNNGINIDLDNGITSGFSIFNVFQVPGKNSLGMVVEYELLISPDLEDSTEKIHVNLERSELAVQNNVSLQFSSSETRYADLLLPSVSSTGLYRIDVNATGELTYVKIQFNTYPSQNYYNLYMYSTDNNNSLDIYMTSETILAAKIKGFSSNHKPRIQYDFSITKLDTPILESKTYQLSGPLSLKMPGLFLPKSLKIDYSGVDDVSINIISSLNTETIAYLSPDEKLSMVVFEHGYEANGRSNTIPNPEVRIENSIWPLYDDSYTFKNTGFIIKKVRSPDIDSNRFSISQYVYNMNQLSDSPIYLQIKSFTKENSDIKISISDYEPLYLTDSVDKQIIISKDSDVDLYEIEISAKSQKIIVDGEFESSKLTYEDGIQTQAYFNGGVTIFGPDMSKSIDKVRNQQIDSEFAIFQPGTYYVAVRGSIGINLDTETIDENKVMISVKLNITQAIGEIILERSTETFILDSGSTQMRVFTIEKDTAYQVFADMAPFTAGSLYTYISITFVDQDGSNPFRENSYISMFPPTSFKSQLLTAKESTRVFLQISGTGYLNLTIVKIGKVDITQIYHVSEIEESDFPKLFYFAIILSVTYVRKKRR